MLKVDGGKPAVSARPPSLLCIRKRRNRGKHTHVESSPTAERTQLRKSLKLWQIVMIGLAYLTPMTVFDTFGIVSGISQGHVPTAYLLALAGVLFTAISYGKLVRQFPTAGSAYTYAQRAINPHVGFMVGWSSLLDYLFLPMINALLAKIYLTALFPEVARGSGW